MKKTIFFLLFSCLSTPFLFAQKKQPKHQTPIIEKARRNELQVSVLPVLKSMAGLETVKKNPSFLITYKKDLADSRRWQAGVMMNATVENGTVPSKIISLPDTLRMGYLNKFTSQMSFFTGIETVKTSKTNPRLQFCYSLNVVASVKQFNRTVAYKNYKKELDGTLRLINEETNLVNLNPNDYENINRYQHTGLGILLGGGAEYRIGQRAWLGFTAIASFAKVVDNRSVINSVSGVPYLSWRF